MPAAASAISPSPAPLPRARGRARLSCRGLDRGTGIGELQTQGCVKLLFPRPRSPMLEAVAINTSGGITGGDELSYSYTAGPRAQLSLTTQAAERAYRASSGTARIETRLEAGEGATLFWLPQEMILFEGASLDRRLHCDLAPDARLLLVEPLVFGRRLMGERLLTGSLSDRIEIDRDGAPLYRDRLRLATGLDAHPRGEALTLGHRAMASLVYVAPDAEARLGALRAGLPDHAGASLLAPDTLVARLLGADGYELRRALHPALELLAGAPLPAVWRT